MGFGTSKQSSQNQSQQTSESRNQAYPFLQSVLGGQVNNAGAGSSALASMLGLNGAPASNAAFNQFRDSSGYNFIRDEGVKGIEGSMAAKGLLGSGSALKAITGYSSNLANNYLNNYLSQLSNLSGIGLQAGQVLASAGNTANSQGTSYGTSKGSSTNFSLG